MQQLALTLVTDGSFAASVSASSSTTASSKSPPRCPLPRRGAAPPSPRPVLGRADGARAGTPARALVDEKGAPLRVREMFGGGGDSGEWKDSDLEAAGAAAFHWVLEESSTSTRENALYSLQECRRRGWARVAVVTNRFHQFRAKRVFEVAAAEMALEGGGAGGAPVAVTVQVAYMPPALETAVQFPPRGAGAVLRARELWRVGPARYCSPHHRMPLNSRNEGSKCVSIMWQATSSRP